MPRSDAEYATLREQLLERTTRATSSSPLETGRDPLFEPRTSPLAGGGSLHHLEDLAAIVRSDDTAHLQRSVAQAMAINETSFFRDIKPFEALRYCVLPRLIDKNRHQRRLRLWSAACSTGQEPYSLAMLLWEHFPELSQWDIQILGTDSSSAALDYARRARYRRGEVNRGLPVRMLVRYFRRDGEEWELKPHIRALCDFQQADLYAIPQELPVFDLILMRNVLLHIPQQNRRLVFGRISRHLDPAGYLLLGQAEQAEDSTDLFQADLFQGTSCYRPVAVS